MSFEYRRGLSELYNESIDKETDTEVVLFAHDDIWIHDYFFVDRLFEGIREFDIIGIAGNRVRVPGQVAWFSNGPQLQPNKEYLSGVLGHGKSVPGPAHVFGSTPSERELLDGCFIAANMKKLRETQTKFDPAFKFHFYDLDFCRTAKKNGLRIGTWQVSLTHESMGHYDSPDWREASKAYFQKWGS